MKKSLYILCILMPLMSCQKKPETNDVIKSNQAKEISFITSDSIKVFGDLYELDKNAKTILLFHQGGSNARGEYLTIIPKLIKMGFNILAIDQRVGGQVYGNYNRTIANIPDYNFEDGYSYCDAHSNIEGALDFIIESGFTGEKILWGSSYSASLAINLGNKRPNDINKVIAFSPATGNSMKNCLPNASLETLEVPLLLLRPPHEMGRENVIAQFELAKANGHQTYVAKYGVHGASMLVESRVKNDTDQTWDVVTSFLEQKEQ
ncbi:MAG: hypothetical protein AAFX55_04240 [Bacteroidota bacterium]